MHNQKKDKVFVLFSGGKDSSLAAFILAKIFEVELITVTFGLLENWKQAQEIANKLGFPFKLIKLDKEILEKAAKMVISDGYPANGIKYIHKRVLEEIAKRDFKIIADGIEREDHTATLSPLEIKHFEEKSGVHYLQPLRGYSRKTIDFLANQLFSFKKYKGESFPGAEYEFELREVIKRDYGAEKIKSIFPKYHTHSIINEVKSANKSPELNG